LGLAIAGHWPDHWHGFEAMALIMSNTQESRYMLILAMLLLALAIGLASSRTCAAEAESVPIQDLNKGDPNKGCAGENSYLRNGICWQRVITDPRFKSYEDHVTCHKADGTVEIRINKYALVDVIHVTEGKRLQHPRMPVIEGEDELKWETTRDDGLEIQGSFAGEGLHTYTESLYRDGKLIAQITARCKSKAKD
jgi:hypothetical protein